MQYTPGITQHFKLLFEGVDQVACDNVDKSHLYIVKVHLSNYIGSKWHANTHIMDEATFCLPVISELSVFRALQRAYASPDNVLQCHAGMEILQDERELFMTVCTRKKWPTQCQSRIFKTSHSSCLVHNTCCCIQQPVPKPPHPPPYPIFSENLSPQYIAQVI